MEPKEREKTVNWFKAAISYEELNLVKIQNDCLRDWRGIFPPASLSRKRGEEILNKLILDSLDHALIFANLVIKIYEKELRKF